MSVFVTDADYKHTLAIVRSLGCKGVVVDVGSPSHNMQLSSFSKYVRKSFVYPDPKENPSRFVHFIRTLSEMIDCKVIIPVGYDATFSLSMKKKALGGDLKIPVADFSSMKIAGNKHDTILLAEKMGIPIPKTMSLPHLSDLDVFLKNINYPIVVKGLYESGFVRYAYSKKDLKEKVAEIYESQRVPPLLQEFVKGEGYGFFALFNHGKPKAIFMHRRIRERPATGGPSTCAESVYIPKLMDYGLKMLKALKWHGVAMVEFRKDSRDGTFKLMEINPKFWGSLDLAIASGVDFPYLLYKMAMDGDVNPVFSYKLGVRFMWPFSDLLRILEKPQHLKYFFSDLLNPHVAKNININDLDPNFFLLAKPTLHITSKFTDSRG